MDVRVASMGGVATAVVPWRFRGLLRLTAVVKLSLAVKPGARMELAAAEAVNLADGTRTGIGALEQQDESAPHQALMDVTMSADAHLPEGASEVEARLALGTAERTLLDKRLRVRRAHLGRQSVPISWGHAWGGLGHRDNPLGTGFGSMSPDPPWVRYLDGADRTACFSPIPATFPVRRSLLGSLTSSALRGRPLALPDDFDWEFFQSAPADQRVLPPKPELLHHLWIVADNVHASHQRVASQLPELVVEARAWLGGQAASFPLVPTKLHLFAPDLKASLVFAGTIALPEEVALEDVVVVGAAAGGPIDWPASPPVVPAPARGLDASGASDLEGTVVIDPEFASTAASTKSGQTLGPPTLADSPFESTVLLASHEPAPSAMPFVGPAGGAVPTTPAHSAIPGAPWSDEPAVAVVTPSHDFSSTMVGAAEESTAIEAPSSKASKELERLQVAQEAAEREAAAEAAELRRKREADEFSDAQRQARVRQQGAKVETDKRRAEDASKLRRGLYAGLGRRRAQKPGRKD
jgi:Uncharacterized protein conserved in bacteria (DUF2169)